MTITPIQPATPFEQVDIDAGLVAPRRGALLPSRRTFGGKFPSRRTFGGKFPSRRTFGRNLPSRRIFGARLP